MNTHHMTPEQINRAIAEWHLCYEYRNEGWRYPDEKDWQEFTAVYTADGGFIGLNKPEWPIGPNYHGDLNACREAVLLLTYEQAQEFDERLCDICEKANSLSENPAPWRFAVTNASAPQRCEALLKTLGKIP